MANIDIKRAASYIAILAEEDTMGSTLNLSLTDELRTFVDDQSGDGTLYATPSEFVRDLIRKHKQQLEAEQLRVGVIEGLHDAAEGRVHLFDGSVRALIKKCNR